MSVSLCIITDLLSRFKGGSVFSVRLVLYERKGPKPATVPNGK